MSDLLLWHPSSEKGRLVFEQRVDIAEKIYANPVETFKYLKEQLNFGRVSELWDDYIFENCVRPVLQRLVNDDLSHAINRYSIIDHLLFETYIRREEDPTRFRRAFWNVNFFGQLLANRFSDIDLIVEDVKRKNLIQTPSNSSASEVRKIAFVLKGPYALAHVEFLHSFLEGCNIFGRKVKVFLILIDSSAKKVINLKHLNV